MRHPMQHMITRTHPFATVDVFTENRFGGNPLAVITDALGLSDSEMQALAAEFNYSPVRVTGRAVGAEATVRGLGRR